LSTIRPLRDATVNVAHTIHGYLRTKQAGQGDIVTKNTHL